MSVDRLLVGLLLTVLFCASARPVHGQRSREAEENAVIIALLDTTYQTRNNVILIDSTRVTWAHGRPLQGERESLLALAGVDSAALVDYLDINSYPRLLTGLTPGRLLFEVTADSVMRTFPQGIVPDGLGYRSEYWDAFRARYPGRDGIVRVSRPGFNQDRSVAIVDAFLSCGMLCGRGGLFVLHKIDGYWRVVANPVTSES